MEYTPQPDTRRARRIMWAFLLGGAVCFPAAAMLPFGRAVLQLAGVALVACGLYVAGRWLFTSFTYAIVLRGTADPDELAGAQTAAAGAAPDVRRLPNALLDFTVRKSQGRRAPVMDACLALDELRYFAPLPREGGREREPYRLFPALRVYDYTVTMTPAQQYMAVFVDSANNAIGLIFEPDAAMAAYLASVLQQNAGSSGNTDGGAAF